MCVCVLAASEVWWTISAILLPFKLLLWNDLSKCSWEQKSNKSVSPRHAAYGCLENDIEVCEVVVKGTSDFIYMN